MRHELKKIKYSLLHVQLFNKSHLLHNVISSYINKLQNIDLDFVKIHKFNSKLNSSFESS